MFKFLRNVLISGAIVLVIVTGFMLASHGLFGKGEAKIPEVKGVNTIPSLTALLVQIESNGTKNILSCGGNGCVSKPSVLSVGEDALTDGSVWYRYSAHSTTQGSKIIALEKVKEDGSIETISEENDLVRPRGLTMSPDGTKIAYFLDNIHDKNNLTELWVYDSKRGGSQVVAERLQRKDIASRVRWSLSGRVAWVLQDGDTRTFTVIPTEGKSSPRNVFPAIDWNKSADSADAGVMDITDDARMIAYTTPTFFGFSQLTIAQDEGDITHHSIKGQVVFIKWMEDGALFYVVQDGDNLTFWIVNSAGERPVARMKGQFQSAHNAGSSDLVGFVADPVAEERHLYVLQLSSGQIKDETVVPYTSGATYLIQANEAEIEHQQAMTAITGTLHDEELLAFVSDHIKDITGDHQAQIERMLATAIANTVYLDYSSGDTHEKRILLVVQDALHPAWQILAKYVPLGGQWKREQESGSLDPVPTKLYEWEKDISQWILKETY